MVKTKREYILITFVISCICLAVTIASISTKNWVNSDAVFYKTNKKNGEANYGLFKGNWNVDIEGTKIVNEITIQCLISENVCGWSYESTSQNQWNEIQKIFLGNFDICWKTVAEENKPKCDLRFINAGLWISSLFFIFFSLVCTITTAFLSVLNFYTSPTRDILSIQGIFIVNAVSSGGYLLSLILWGSQFGALISNNIAITDTLLGKFSTEGLATLGFSYWILLLPMFLHALNIGVLFYRKFQIDKEPSMPKIDVDPSKDGISFLY